MITSRRKTVLFLGAGASKPLGYPLTAELMPKAWDKAKRRTLFGRYERNECTNLLRLIRKLYPGICRPWNNLPDITHVLSFIDYMLSKGQQPVGQINRVELERLRLLLERSICELVYRPAKSQKIHSMRSSWQKWIQTKLSNSELTFVTSNYDQSIEDILLKDKRKNLPELVDLGMAWVDCFSRKELEYQRPEKATFRIYNLHGSLSWLSCSNCGLVYVNPRERFVFDSAFFSKSNQNTCHCGYCPLRPVIISPSFARPEPIKAIQDVWRASEVALRNADEWIIVGYSLPGEDLNIRSLLARAHASGNKRHKVRIFLKDDEGAAARYRLMFASATISQRGLEGLVEGR